MQAKGFIKVCAITPELLVGNPNYNVSIINLAVHYHPNLELYKPIYFLLSAKK